MRRNVTLAVIPPLTLLVVWEVLVRAHLISALFFPAPSSIFQEMYELTRSGRLIFDLGMSLRRVLLGFALGVVPGVVIGLAVGWSPRTRLLVDPLISLTYPIPKLALLPMIMLIFGIGDASKVVMVAVGTFFPAAISSAAGVLGISPTYFEVARNLKASRYKTFTRVVLPGALPIVFAGLRLAFGTALLVVIGAEFVAAREGIGAMIWQSWMTLSTEMLYAGIIAWGAVGLISTYLLALLQRGVIRWSPETRR